MVQFFDDAPAGFLLEADFELGNTDQSDTYQAIQQPLGCVKL
jgi:hypothetical protein